MQSEDILPEQEEGGKPAIDPEAKAVSGAEVTEKPGESEQSIAERYKELEDKYLRLAAEFENYKKRMAREYIRIMETSTDDYSRELLDIVDDFERALSHSDAGSEVIRQGMDLILAKMNELLKKKGIEKIAAVGERFDPALHEAVAQIESNTTEEGIILEEIQKGYRADGRILRPARVAVAKRKEN